VKDYGIGPLKPNTIMLAHTENPEHHDWFCHMIGHLYDANRNVVVLAAEDISFPEVLA
jgi:translation elongation factor EF-Tu-like GTPase